MNKSIKTIMALLILLGAGAPMSVLAEENIETNNDVVEVVREHIPNPGFSEIVEVDPSSEPSRTNQHWENNEKPVHWNVKGWNAPGTIPSTVNEGIVTIDTIKPGTLSAPKLYSDMFYTPTLWESGNNDQSFIVSGMYKLELKDSTKGKSYISVYGADDVTQKGKVMSKVELLSTGDWEYFEVSLEGGYDFAYIDFSIASGKMFSVKDVSVKTSFKPIDVTVSSVVHVKNAEELEEFESNGYEVLNTKLYSSSWSGDEVDVDVPGEYKRTLITRDNRHGYQLPENEEYLVIEKEVIVIVDMELVPLEPSTPIVQVVTPEQINVLEGDDLPNIEDLVDVTNSENYEIVIDSSNVDTNTPGKYIVTVTVTDTDTNIVVNKEVVVIVDMKLIPLEPGTPIIPLTPLEPATPIEPEVPLTPIEPSTPIVPEQPVAPTVPETPGETPTETPSVTGPVVEIPTEQLIDELPSTGVASGSLSAIGSVTSLLGALFIMLKRKQ